MPEKGDKSLKKSAVRGGALASVSRLVRLLFQFVSIAILARLLSPADFGLVGTVAGAAAIISLFRELGLSLAIVQREKIEDADLSCIFRFTIFLGLGLLLLSVVLGFLISWIFERKELVYIAPFFGLAVMISALEVIPLGLMRRNLQFGRIAVREIISTLTGTILGLLAAWLGAGYWALVIAPVAMQGANTLFSWLAVNWRPSRVPFQWQIVNPYLKFGGTLTFGELANYLCQNLDVLLIGKLWGLEPLGYFTRARALIANPINQIAAPMGSVLTPVFSRMKGDEERQRHWIKNIYSAMLLLGGVSGACIAVCANDIVNILLGDGWSSVGGIVFWMAPLILVRPAGTVLYCYLISNGNLRSLLSWTWIGSAITISAIVIGSQFGAEAVAAGLSIAICLRMFVAIYFCSTTGVVKFWELAIRGGAGLVHLAVLITFFLWLTSLATVENLNAYARLVLMGAVSAGIIALWIISLKTWRDSLICVLRSLIRGGSRPVGS